jgi:hypothetical protein
MEMKGLDSLDKRIVERAEQHEDGIPIYKLHEYPEFVEVPLSTFRYRLYSLEDAGEVRLAHRRKYIYVYPSL